MAFEKVSAILKDADTKRTAVLAYDCFNFESIAWLVEAGEELGIPVIVMLYPGLMESIPAHVFAAITKAMAKKVKIPVGLHLDHCDSYETILGTIRDGFTSVMIDGSKLEYAENVRVTCEIVKAAHALGIDVEAELGKVGTAANKGDFKNEDLYTTAAQAADFVAKTKVDSLAIAIGSAHGWYVETPKLSMPRLKEINSAIDTPLVLHGGTGIPEDQLKESFKLGINKLNVGTEYFAIFYSTIKDYQQLKDKKESFAALQSYQKKVIKEYLRNKLLLTMPDKKTSR
jgi:fructose-bisphosphate aldolase, class II